MRDCSFNCRDPIVHFLPNSEKTDGEILFGLAIAPTNTESAYRYFRRNAVDTGLSNGIDFTCKLRATGLVFFLYTVFARQADSKQML